MDLKPNIPYIITKGNDTFEIGDHFRLESDGTIICRESGGWLKVEDVPEGIAGIEYVEDKEDINLIIQRKTEELERLKNPAISDSKG